MERSQTNDRESLKVKLTLGIDRNVLEKAKAAGINISAITENLLKAITYQPNGGNTREDVARAYKVLFEKARSLMSKYSSSELQICVGETELRKVFLDSEYGLLLCDNHNNYIIEDNASVDSVLEHLYKPMKILEKLIVNLTRIAEENKEKLAELKFALRLVKVLSDDEGEHEK